MCTIYGASNGIVTRAVHDVTRDRQSLLLSREGQQASLVLAPGKVSIIGE